MIKSLQSTNARIDWLAVLIITGGWFCLFVWFIKAVMVLSILKKGGI
jgi:hypothetical protein